MSTGTPPISLRILIPGGLSGEGRQENQAECTLAGQTKYAKGHSERPLAEVFSQMPRCAPLRLPLGGACQVPLLRHCQHADVER